MKLIGLLQRLAADRCGAAAIEFAIMGPIVIGLMISVLQAGMAMQSYNAIRNLSADTARYALVEYQKGNSPANEAIRAEAMEIADGPPYLLNSDRLTIDVADAAVQRVDGAREVTITTAYQIPNVLPLFDYVSPTISHSRPIFLLEKS